MKLPSKRTILRKIKFILEHAVERELFTLEWSQACLGVLYGESHEKLMTLLDEWYATAEMDAIPGMRETAIRARARAESGRVEGVCREYAPSDPID